MSKKVIGNKPGSAHVFPMMNCCAAHGDHLTEMFHMRRLKRTLKLLCLGFSLLSWGVVGNVYGEMMIPSSWDQAKKLARDEVYSDHAETFYCGCSYTPTGRSGGAIEEQGCGYVAGEQKHAHRASRLEWEHVVPASLTPARSMQCWNAGLPECSKPGRDCCEDHDPVAQAIIFDLHNLVPSVGQVNALRDNKRYGVIPDEARLLGSCDFEWSSDIAEPPEEKQGEVARTWLYMRHRHGLELLPGELTMYRVWSCNDPPSQWEVARNDRIKQIQGNGNPFVDRPCD